MQFKFSKKTVEEFYEIVTVDVKSVDKVITASFISRTTFDAADKSATSFGTGSFLCSLALS